MTNYSVEKLNQKITVPLKRSTTISKLARLVIHYRKFSFHHWLITRSIVEKNKKHIVDKMSQRNSCSCDLSNRPCLPCYDLIRYRPVSTWGVKSVLMSDHSGSHSTSCCTVIEGVTSSLFHLLLSKVT